MLIPQLPKRACAVEVVNDDEIVKSHVLSKIRALVCRRTEDMLP